MQWAPGVGARQRPLCHPPPSPCRMGCSGSVHFTFRDHRCLLQLRCAGTSRGRFEALLPRSREKKGSSAGERRGFRAAPLSHRDSADGNRQPDRGVLWAERQRDQSPDVGAPTPTPGSRCPYRALRYARRSALRHGSHSVPGAPMARPADGLTETRQASGTGMKHSERRKAQTHNPARPSEPKGRSGASPTRSQRSPPPPSQCRKRRHQRRL